MIVKTTNFNYKGQVHAENEDKKFLIWNALPGEEVEVNIIKKKAATYFGVATKVIKPSADRIENLEDSFLSTSPWQILTWEKELEYKVQIVKSLFDEVNIETPKNLEILTDNNQLGYRNKMEFSFFENEDQSISLAFFKREGKGKIPVDGSKLAESVINDSAIKILKWVNEQKIPIRSLKTLILRSNGANESIAGLFIKDELEFKVLPEVSKTLLGIQIFYSTHKSPASVPTKLLYTIGNNELITKVKDVNLKFGLFSFFQINVPIFEKAVEDIAKTLDDKSEILDFYSGVGSISLAIKDKLKNSTLVESNAEAVEYAKENIATNKAKHFYPLVIESEKALEFISKDKIIIFDPPRTGLHKKVIERIKEVQPERIIYLSCGPETQAKDISEIKDLYEIEFMRIYNFFPRTPHVESLVMLRKKA